MVDRPVDRIEEGLERCPVGEVADPVAGVLSEFGRLLAGVVRVSTGHRDAVSSGHGRPGDLEAEASGSTDDDDVLAAHCALLWSTSLSRVYRSTRRLSKAQGFFEHSHGAFDLRPVCRDGHSRRRSRTRKCAHRQGPGATIGTSTNERRAHPCESSTPEFGRSSPSAPLQQSSPSPAAVRQATGRTRRLSPPRPPRRPSPPRQLSPLRLRPIPRLQARARTRSPIRRGRPRGRAMRR